MCEFFLVGNACVWVWARISCDDGFLFPSKPKATTKSKTRKKTRPKFVMLICQPSEATCIGFDDVLKMMMKRRQTNHICQCNVDPWQHWNSFFFALISLSPVWLICRWFYYVQAHQTFPIIQTSWHITGTENHFLSPHTVHTSFSPYC